MESYQNKKGMTLIEILMVISIIAILFSLFFYIWNTVDIFRKARDSKRLNDLNLLNTAIQSILNIQSDTYLGDENIIYLSLPDSTSTCGSYNLIQLYPPYSYHCQNQNDFRKVDGSGWLPVNLTLSKIIGVSILPIDPLNNQDYFYAYQVKGGRYKLTAKFESDSYLPKMVNDGGFEPTLYEVGSNLKIPSPHSGLVGYFSFDETGTTVYDLSGYNNNGIMYSSTTVFDLHSTSSCKIGYCGNFDGLDDYVKINNNLDYSQNAFTVLAWINTQDITSCRRSIVSSKESASSGFVLAQPEGACNKIRIWANISGIWQSVDSFDNISTSTWYFVGGSYDSKVLKVYLNDKINSANFSGTLSNSSATTNIGSRNSSDIYFFSGKIDEVRIYNRPLSDNEIKLIYEATK